ncbi:hypothetical protein EPN90_04965 [Patescibacteria group bacterium]|nr:MAG: hypothetical protein EPN90_04965 [Patescibacteria group bacterium]
MDPNSLPPNDLTEKQLKFGYWYITHKLKLRRVLILILLIIDAGLLLFSVGFAVKLYLIDYVRDVRLERELGRNLVNPAAIAAALAKPLLRKEVQVLDGGKGLVDVYAEISNPNLNYWATWTGQFVGENTTTTKKTEYVLPGETKSVIDLGLESPSRMAGARYEISDFAWHKVNPHLVPDYPRYRDDHLKFEVSDAQFASTASADGKGVVSRVSFTVTNHSAYGYWTVNFLAKLYRGTALVAVNSVELQQLETGEVRNVDLIWVQDLAAISKVEITPSVNILDPKAIMPPSAVGSE